MHCELKASPIADDEKLRRYQLPKSISACCGSTAALHRVVLPAHTEARPMRKINPLQPPVDWPERVRVHV
eukprot:1357680-Pleurochrysis_carterae.AAC.2